MSSYLQPIKSPEAEYTIHFKRFNPETDSEPHWETYRVPFVRSMTVIQALEYLWDQNDYIAFRSNCREMTCGSCAMVIDGRPQLACMTLLEDNAKVAPPSNYPVLRDLIVDAASVESKYRELRLWPLVEGPGKIENVSRATMESYSHIYSRCIECYACLEACPKSDAESTQFDGPMFMLQIARVAGHPLDSAERGLQAFQRGALSCVNCYECASVCPVGLDPAAEVNRLRRLGLREAVGRFWREKIARLFPSSPG